jgi:hypothetical protein
MSSNPASSNVAILVNVDLEPNGSNIPSTSQDSVKPGPKPVRSVDSSEDSILVADQDFIRTYQNQTAEDIESGRARMDSLTSYG